MRYGSAIVGGALAVVLTVSACSSPPGTARPSIVPVPSAPGGPDQPLDVLAAGVLRQLGLAPAPSVVLSANPARMPVPKPGQYLSALTDFELSNESAQSAWILPGQTVFRWTGSTWEWVGCTDRMFGIDERFGFCGGGVEIKNELLAGAVANERTEPIGFFVTWPLTAEPPTVAQAGFYAFVLPVWDSVLAAERDGPDTAAVVVVELVEAE